MNASYDTGQILGHGVWWVYNGYFAIFKNKIENTDKNFTNLERKVRPRVWEIL